MATPNGGLWEIPGDAQPPKSGVEGSCDRPGVQLEERIQNKGALMIIPT